MNRNRIGEHCGNSIHRGLRMRGHSLRVFGVAASNAQLPLSGLPDRKRERLFANIGYGEQSREIDKGPAGAF